MKNAEHDASNMPVRHTVQVRLTCIVAGAVDTHLPETITDESISKFIEGSKNMERLQ